jgi:hypothetical protein
MAFTRPGGESVVVTSASLVARRTARRAGFLIIDCDADAPLLMKWRLLALKASTSPPSLESNESPGIQFIAGLKEQPHGVDGSITEK